MTDTVSAAALRESEELHRITLLSMSDAVFITDDDGAFTFICPNADVIFGYGPDEVRAMGRISRLFGVEPMDVSRLAESEEVRNIELEIEAKGGARKVVLVHIKAVSIKGGTVLYVCRDITERKQSELALRRNEQRLSLALEAADAGTWDWDVPTGEMSWSLQTRRMLGDVPDDHPATFDAFLERVHPSDRERVAQAMTTAMEHGGSYETEFRVLDGCRAERWIMGRGRAIRNGKPLRMLGVFVDTTDCHHVEQELQELGGRLINAHEAERTRLAQELHDDVAQRLALVTAELGELRDKLTADAPLHAQAVTLSAEAEKIGAALHRLSHELHPGWLQALGLGASIRQLCDEIGKAYHITMQPEISEASAAVTSDVALCLYRIAQEALRNVVKHSNAARAMVTLNVDGGEIVLSIVDDGVGFDPDTKRPAGGLGLITMQERARFIHGNLALTSKPGQGTRTEVRVPILRG